MQIFWEIFGYVGTGLVIVSMMMTSVKWLRIVNLSGSLISLIYALVVAAYPVVVLNGSLVIINLFRLFQLWKKSRVTME